MNEVNKEKPFDKINVFQHRRGNYNLIDFNTTRFLIPSKLKYFRQIPNWFHQIKPWVKTIIIFFDEQISEKNIENVKCFLQS